MTVEAIMVEVRRLDVKQGDVVLVTPQADLQAEQEQNLIAGLGQLTRRTNIHFVLFSRHLEATVVAKERA